MKKAFALFFIIGSALCAHTQPEPPAPPPDLATSYEVALTPVDQIQEAGISIGSPDAEITPARKVYRLHLEKTLLPDRYVFIGGPVRESTYWSEINQPARTKDFPDPSDDSKLAVKQPKKFDNTPLYLHKE